MSARPFVIHPFLNRLKLLLFQYDESFESDGITITDETTPSLAHSFEQDTVETPSESQKKDALASFINTAIGKVRRKTYFSQLEKRVSKEKGELYFHYTLKKPLMIG